MAIKIVIFDFDGTLVDTRKTIVAAKQETMKKLSLQVFDEETCASTIGLSSKMGFQKLYPEMSDDDLNSLVLEYRRIFDAMKQKIPPTCFSGVKNVLAELKNLKILTTIASSRATDSLNEFLSEWRLSEFFPYVLGGDSTANTKPNPEPVQKTLSELSFNANEALVVGDMPVDIQMGKGANAWTCGVTFGNATKSDLVNAGADYIIDKIEDLLNIVC